VVVAGCPTLGSVSQPRARENRSWLQLSTGNAI
jgi:hypothetical protein